MKAARGQALVEMALVTPLFFMVLFGIVVLGVAVFYNQQLTNAAREAARYAAVHSATAQCPTVPNLDPGGIDAGTGYTSAAQAPLSYLRCQTAASGWTGMVGQARSKVFGLDPSRVLFSACWSGYRDPERANYDARPPGTYQVNTQAVTINSTWAQCTIGGQDPTTSVGAIACESGLSRADTASAASPGGAEGRVVANRVTVFACYAWSPPGAGFLLIPTTITFRAAISEPIQRQQ